MALIVAMEQEDLYKIHPLIVQNSKTGQRNTAVWYPCFCLNLFRIFCQGFFPVSIISKKWNNNVILILAYFQTGVF